MSDIKENLDHIAKWDGTAWKALDPGVRGMYQMAEIEDAQIAARDSVAKQLISAGNALIEKLDKLIIFDRDLFTTESLESVEGVESLIDVEQIIANLPMREKQIVYLFACGHSQAEIGEILDLSQQRISQILANISKKHSETA